MKSHTEAGLIQSTRLICVASRNKFDWLFLVWWGKCQQHHPLCVAAMHPGDSSVTMTSSELTGFRLKACCQFLEDSASSYTGRSTWHSRRPRALCKRVLLRRMTALHFFVCWKRHHRWINKSRVNLRASFKVQQLSNTKICEQCDFRDRLLFLGP